MKQHVENISIENSLESTALVFSGELSRARKLDAALQGGAGK
jgi:hypothetical protein